MPSPRQPGLTLPSGSPDVGADRWGSLSSARKSGPQANSNQMPTGMVNGAKNAFGSVLADGRVSEEDLARGYCDYGPGRPEVIQGGVD